MALADAGSDAVYDGAIADSSLSVDYYRQKVTEFQQTLNSLDTTARAGYSLLEVMPDSAERDSIVESLVEFENKRAEFRIAAEALNAAAAAINAAGGRWPVLSIPTTLQGLGIAPALIAGIAGTVAVIGSMIAWAVAWANAVKIKSQAALDMIESLPADQRAPAVRAAQDVIRASETVDSPLASIATIAKWIALGVAAYFGYQALRDMRGNHGG